MSQTKMRVVPSAQGEKDSALLTTIDEYPAERDTLQNSRRPNSSWVIAYQVCDPIGLFIFFTINITPGAYWNKFLVAVATGILLNIDKAIFLLGFIFDCQGYCSGFDQPSNL
jgi:hypothetical protein